MSRTDVHRPYPVLLADPYSRHLFYRFQSWPTEAPTLQPVTNLSGCRICTAHYWRREARRRDRHRTRTILRDLLTQHHAGDLDEDAQPVARYRL